MTKRRRFGLSTRIVLATGLVIVVGVAAALVTSLTIGPREFRKHLVAAGAIPTSPQLEHIEQAYRASNIASLAVALAISLIGALGLGMWVARTVATPLAVLARSARRMAAGHGAEPVAMPVEAPELVEVVTAFNAMASQIEHTEDTRRQMLTDLGHELRTPIATIEGYLDGLEDGVVAWDGATLAVLRAQTHRLLRLTDDINAVSRAQEGRYDLALEPVSAAVLLDDAHAAARDAYSSRGVLLSVDAADVRDVQVNADTERMAQVFANLLDNALRHSEPGGQVELFGRLDGSAVLLEVVDTGTGIAPEHLPHLFERFYHVQPDDPTGRGDQTSGSGVGLTISRALVESHGGRLTASSEGPGRGAVFTISLPTLGDYHE